METERYTIEWVRIASRLPDVSLFGYLAHPHNLPTPRPAVVLLHGAGVPPHTAFGWRLRGDEQHVKYAETPLTRAGISLVEAGYSVFIPWLSDDEMIYNHTGEPLWPAFPWFEFDRWGTQVAEKTGSGSAYSLLVPQVMTTIDFLIRDQGVATNQIALMGWQQGALLAGVTAALDPRVSGTIWLEPPLDKRKLRSSVPSLQSAAAFELLDCSFGHYELAALIAPRPLLFSYATSDPRYPIVEPYVSGNIYHAISQLYANLGAVQGVAQSKVTMARTGAVTVPHQWLTRVFQHQGRTVSDPLDIPTPASTWIYPDADFALRREEMANYLAKLGPCATRTVVPDVGSPTAFKRSVAPLRAELIAALAGSLPPARPIEVLERREISRNTVYRLEWVRFRARFPDIDIGGYLATPHAAQERTPAILSFDANYGFEYTFGLTAEPSRYLNASGDWLARSGNIVFAPYMPSKFADGWGALLSAKTGGARTVWSYVLPVYLSSVDFLVGQPKVDPGRITAYGISYAGAAALYTTAIDQRISTLIYSNPLISKDVYFSDPRTNDAPLWLSLLCSHFNPVQQLLIAPRQFIWENGISDTNDFQAYEFEPVLPIQQVYAALGSPDRFRFVRHDGAHETRPWVIAGLKERPSITAITPAVVSSTRSTLIRITGKNFQPNPIVKIGPIERTGARVDSGTIHVAVPAGCYPTPTVISVRNPDGQIAAALLTSECTAWNRLPMVYTGS